jgi:DNA polymerase-3 subunit beta
VIFSVDKTVISQALLRAVRVVERRLTIPILANVLLTADGEELHLKTTDLDIEFTISAPANIEAGGQITVPAHLLNDIVKKLAGDTVQFKLDKDKQKMFVGAGRAKFELHCLPAHDFPDFSPGQFDNSFDVEAYLLKSLFDRTQFAMSSEETRYYLCGIYLHIAQKLGKDKLRTVATDGHRLALSDAELPDGAAGMPAVIVPRKTVKEFNAILESGGTARLDVSRHKIKLSLGSIVINSKLIDGTFPDYDRVIPTDTTNSVAIFDTGVVSAAADRVSTVSSERGRAVKVIFDEGKMVFKVNNPDSGAAEDEVDVIFEAPRLEIGFNNQYLQDILSNIPSKTARMKMIDPGSPAIVTDEDGDDGLYLLMPMRV